MVLLVVAALAVTPPALAARPVQGPDVTAAQLLARVQATATTPYSGYAQSTGGLALPVTDGLGSLSDLLGATTTVRTWYRSPTDLRVDTQRLTGERGLYVDPTGTWAWDYEANRAVRSPDPAVRLPRAADLVPPELGRRLLSEATADEVSRLPAQRVAGVDAPGLRLTPDDPRSTVAAVDVWVDPATGVALRVEVLGVGGDRPVVSTSFLDFSRATPAPATTRFLPLPGMSVRTDDVTDLAAAANRFSEARAPDELAGLPRRTRLPGDSGAVGTYGRGVTTLVALPLGRRAGGLREALTGVPGAVVDDTGVRVAVGPLTLLLSTPVDGRSWLLTGTVTAETLQGGAAELGAAP